MSERANSQRPQGDLRVHAYSLAYLFAVGGTLVLLTVGFDQPPEQDTVALLGIGLACYAAAALLRFGYRWVREWAYPAFVFLGTCLITFGIYFSGQGSSAYAWFYVWVCIYSFYFFSRLLAAAQLIVVGIAYALVLALGPETSAPASRWILTLGTMAVAGGLVAQLVNAVRARAAEAASRADRLLRAEERTRAIIETANDGFVSADSELRITAYNPQAQAMSGYSLEEVLGKSMTEVLVPARYREAFAAEFKRFVETGESEFVNQPIEFVGVDRHGREFPVE